MNKIVITAISDLSKNLEFEGSVKTLDSAERWVRAGKRAGIIFAAAVVSILIPMAHFILVPSFLALSVYSLISISQKKFAFETGPDSTHAICPMCQKKFELPTKSFNWPLRIDCPNCQAQLRIDQGLT